MNQRLTRDPQNAMLGGVCAGIARRYEFDVTVVRLLWLLLSIFSVGTGVIVYIVVWVIMPRPDQVPPEPRPGEPPAEASSRDFEADLKSVGDRITESARVVARATREATEEITDIARGRSTGAPDQGREDGDQQAPDANEPPADIQPEQHGTPEEQPPEQGIDEPSADGSDDEQRPGGSGTAGPSA